MSRLSINVNKIATLRNSRGSDIPNLLSVVDDLVSWGVQGITVHPRPDGRHILYSDVRMIREKLKETPHVEFNIEGYPSLNFLNLMKEIRPHQCTLVPDPPTALTSHQGWHLKEKFSLLKDVLNQLHSYQIRSSLFIDPLDFNKDQLTSIEQLQPHRVEFYTGLWAEKFQTSEEKKILKIYKDLSEKMNALCIGVNAGHDLNQKNLKPLLKNVPLIQEVSIGHAFICESLYDGLKKTLNRYFEIT